MVTLNRKGLFLQARLNSTRMPGKALLNISGKFLLTHVMDRLSVVPADQRVVLTSSESAEMLRPIVEAAGWELFVGDSQNVLKRFVDAALYYNIDIIIRATGDNPLSSSEIAIETIDLLLKNNADLAYLSPLPYGSGVEAVKTNALIMALQKTISPYDFEHVTPFIYANPKDFKVVTDRYHNEEASRSDIRVSVDTREDYERVNYFIKKINQRKLNMTLHSLVNVWDELDFVRHRTILIISACDSLSGMGKLKRSIALAQILEKDNQVIITLRKESTEGVNCIKHYGLEYASHTDIENQIMAYGAYDRVIIDAGDLTPEEMTLYQSAGTVYAIDNYNENNYSFFNYMTKIDRFDISSNSNLSGLEYLPISTNPHDLKRSFKHNKILVSFGSKDSSFLTNKVLRCLTNRGYDITAVCGPFFTEKIETFEDVKVLYTLYSLDECFKEADVLITNWGMTLFEGIRSGIPVLAISDSYTKQELLSSISYPFVITTDALEMNSVNDILHNTISEIKGFDFKTLYNGLNREVIGSKVSVLKEIITLSNPSVLLCRNCCSLELELVARNPLWNMYKCSKCEFRFLEYFKDISLKYDPEYFLTEYKNQYGKTYEEDREKIRLFASQRITRIKKYKKSGSLLDFGSGPGFFSEYAREHGFNPVCIDVSDYAVEFTKNKLGIEAYQGNESLLEKNSRLFDVITSFYVIEHIRDFEKLLFTFSCHLKSKGVLVLSTPNGSGFTISSKFEEYRKVHPVDHCSIFTPKILKKALEKRGFKNIKIVCTGIHPERILKLPLLINNIFFRKIFIFFIKLAKLGDTFEIYAQKI